MHAVTQKETTDVTDACTTHTHTHHTVYGLTACCMEFAGQVLSCMTEILTLASAAYHAEVTCLTFCPFDLDSGNWSHPSSRMAQYPYLQGLRSSHRHRLSDVLIKPRKYSITSCMLFLLPMIMWYHRMSSSGRMSMGEKWEWVWKGEAGHLISMEWCDYYFGYCVTKGRFPLILGM